MDPSTRNLLMLGAAVAAIYWWCKTQSDSFTPLLAAPYDGPVSDTTVLDTVATAAPVAAVPAVGAGLVVPAATTVPVNPATAALQASAAWQTEAKSINAHADSNNYVDSRAMEGVDSISGWTRKNSTWDVRGTPAIKRDPSASFFGQSSRMPPPPNNNHVFCQ